MFMAQGGVGCLFVVCLFGVYLVLIWCEFGGMHARVCVVGLGGCACVCVCVCVLVCAWG